MGVVVKVEKVQKEAEEVVDQVLVEVRDKEDLQQCQRDDKIYIL